MVEKQGKKTLLYNLAPNGLKIDQVCLTEVPNVDNSGENYLIEYIEDFSNNEKIPIGHCDLINGNIWFDNVGKNAKTLGLNFNALKLITEWIENNIEII
ncbi:MAG: hypothetical protein H6Q19_1490 [Bacteroidetes bacterium]|nr:hypothetical protein [Bacteroidota bacterium]